MNFDKNKIIEIIENFVHTKVIDKGITSNTIIAYKKDLTGDFSILVAADALHPNDNTESINLGTELVFKEFF